MENTSLPIRTGHAEPLYPCCSQRLTTALQVSWDEKAVILQFEQDFWVATEFDVRVTQGAYNIAVGVDFTYFEGRAHTSIAFGPSILAFNTPLDGRGSVGWFMDVRPIGLQWDVHRFVRLGLDPISFAVVAPSLDGIPLVQIEYRTTFYLETPF